MAEPTLTEIFGIGASQTATEITLTKADFTNLTADANNTAESLLIAILLKASENLTLVSFDSNLDQSTYVEPGFSSFTNRGENNDQYRTDQLVVNLAKLDTSAVIDPDDY